MAPKFALFTKGSKLSLNKGFKKCLSYHSLALNPRYSVCQACLSEYLRVDMVLIKSTGSFPKFSKRNDDYDLVFMSLSTLFKSY